MYFTYILPLYFINTASLKLLFVKTSWSYYLNTYIYTNDNFAMFKYIYFLLTMELLMAFPLLLPTRGASFLQSLNNFNL